MYTVKNIGIEKSGISGWIEKICRKIVLKFHRLPRIHKMHKEIHNQDWDYVTIYSLIATKLENMLDYAQKDSVAIYESWSPHMLKRAIALARHLSGEKECYPQHINKNNISRFVREEEVSYFSFKENVDETDKWGIYNRKELDRLAYEEVYDIKARTLFFNILKNYITRWWD